MQESPLTQNGANYNRDAEHTGLDRLSSQHYSTDKSGSSGYYSSNMYSTGSAAYEHIYNDPVLQQPAADVDGGTVAAPATAARFSDRESRAFGMSVPSPERTEHIDTQRTRLSRRHQIDVAYLQNSKKYLEAHWQALNAPPVFDDSSEEFAGGYRAGSRRSLRLPTIMEGIDNPLQYPLAQTAAKGTLRPWQEDHYDSLLDLDFDSFMMANSDEQPNKTSSSKHETNLKIDEFEMPAQAIDPFSHNLIENNYKCRKYVNSCPEDPYQLDGGIFDAQRVPHHNPASVTSYLDQLHLENTTYVLETIRTKLNEILVSSNETNAYEIEESSHFKDDLNALKNDLDTYLCIIKENNEYEIKQFYTGLSQNHNLQTLQNALGNRMKTVNSRKAVSPVLRESATDTVSIQNESSYCERDESQFDTVYVQDGFSFGYKSKDPFRLDFSQMKPPSFEQPPVDSEHDGLSFSSDLSIHPDAYAHQGNHIGATRTNPISEPSDDATAFDSDVTLRHPQYQIQRKMIRPQRNFGRTSLNAALAANTSVPYLSYHRDKPSIWEQYYGANRLGQSILDHRTMLSYPSSRPESDFTLDLPRAEQLRQKLKRDKQNRNRCKLITSFMSLVFFLLTVMIVSLLLSRGKRIFGSMI